MIFRAAASLTVMTGILAFVGTAAAQYNPPPPGFPAPYRPGSAPAYDPPPPPGFPAPYRQGQPPAYDPDDDEQYIPSAPGPYGRSSANAPYPYDPQPPRYGAPPVERQPLPPGPGAGVPGRDPYVIPYEDRSATRAPDGPPPGFPAPYRPPADIPSSQQGSIIDLNRGPGPVTPGMRPPAAVGSNSPAAVASLPPEDQPETGERKALPDNLRRQMVDFQTREPAGTIVIDTPNTYLYMVLGNGKAVRYGIGVGREGFTWNGTERISRMAEWPDWNPPAEMIERQPYLPRFMAGGESNPLGARALYLGKTLYRIHGTNQPSTIGSFVSSGCIRLINDDVADLYSRVQVGTRVVVLPGSAPASASAVR